MTASMMVLASVVVFLVVNAPTVNLDRLKAILARKQRPAQPEIDR
jgi:hypothetical protein